jgi:hypothetical protein
MPLRGPTLLCPLIPLADQHLHAQIIPIMSISHQCPTAKHKQLNNLINKKEGIHKSK